MRNEVGRQPRFPDPLEDLTSAAENWEGRWAECTCLGLHLWAKQNREELRTCGNAFWCFHV